MFTDENQFSSPRESIKKGIYCHLQLILIGIPLAVLMSSCVFVSDYQQAVEKSAAPISEAGRYCVPQVAHNYWESFRLNGDYEQENTATASIWVGKDKCAYVFGGGIYGIKRFSPSDNQYKMPDDISQLPSFLKLGLACPRSVILPGGNGPVIWVEDQGLFYYFPMFVGDVLFSQSLTDKGFNKTPAGKRQGLTVLTNMTCSSWAWNSKGKTIYIFGGIDWKSRLLQRDEVQFKRDIYRCDLGTKEPIRIGELPMNLLKAGAVYIPTKEAVYLFGGITGKDRIKVGTEIDGTDLTFASNPLAFFPQSGKFETLKTRGMSIKATHITPIWDEQNKVVWLFACSPVPGIQIKTPYMGWSWWEPNEYRLDIAKFDPETQETTDVGWSIPHVGYNKTAVYAPDEKVIYIFADQRIYKNNKLFGGVPTVYRFDPQSCLQKKGSR